MHLDPVGLQCRAHAHTVLPSIVTQLIRYYPPPEVFHSGSGHTMVKSGIADVCVLVPPDLRIALDISQALSSAWISRCEIYYLLVLNVDGASLAWV
jgi:hypothetical protein